MFLWFSLMLRLTTVTSRCLSAHSPFVTMICVEIMVSAELFLEPSSVSEWSVCFAQEKNQIFASHIACSSFTYLIQKMNVVAVTIGGVRVEGEIAVLRVEGEEVE